MPASAPQQQPREDVDLDEVLHYLPDLTLLVKKKSVGLSDEEGEEGVCSSPLMTSVHASPGPVGACFNTHFEKKNGNNFEGRKKEKYGY